MGILKLYDYIYYRIVYFYKKNYSTGSLFAGVIILSFSRSNYQCSGIRHLSESSFSNLLIVWTGVSCPLSKGIK